MALVFNPPPNWPKPPAGWSPTPTWRPDPAWGPVPEGWQLWIEEPEPENEQAPSTAESSSAASGSSEGSSSAKPSPSSSSEQSGESAQGSAPKQRTAPTISEQFAEQKTSHQQTPEQKTQAESAHAQDAAPAGSESREVAGERAGASGSGAATGSSVESQVRSEQSTSETPVNRQSGTAEAPKPQVPEPTREPARDTHNAPSAPEASAQQPGVAQGSGVSYDAREPSATHRILRGPQVLPLQQVPNGPRLHDRSLYLQNPHSSRFLHASRAPSSLRVSLRVSLRMRAPSPTSDARDSA